MHRKLKSVVVRINIFVEVTQRFSAQSKTLVYFNFWMQCNNAWCGTSLKNMLPLFLRIIPGDKPKKSDDHIRYICVISRQGCPHYARGLEYGQGIDLEIFMFSNIIPWDLERQLFLALQLRPLHPNEEINQLMNESTNE